MLLHFDNIYETEDQELIFNDLIIDKKRINAIVVDTINQEAVLNINFTFDNYPYTQRYFYAFIDKFADIVHYLDNNLSEYCKLGDLSTGRRTYINMDKVSNIKVVKSLNKEFRTAEVHFSVESFVEISDIEEFNEFKRKYELDHL